MVQFRAMDDNADDVAQVLAVVLPLLGDCPNLVVSGPRRLGHRGGGGRVVFEVMLAPERDGRQWANADRVDDQPPALPRERAPRRALPRAPR
ncbi:hypothetical protein [Nonomuraea sp. NPDC049784]|uniref:hypothetical protein n=1 Tax=Nonomuraea sp. NPDC049784 TaxID=3154361 RepID=UPI0033E46A3E